MHVRYFGDTIRYLDVALQTRSSFSNSIQLVLLCWNCNVVVGELLSFLSCVGCRYFRFAPLASISFASHHTSRTRNCSKPSFIYQCQALFCSSPMIHIWDTHEDNQRHHEDMKKTCSPARPPEPNPTPNPAQRARHGQIPRPTQPSAPSRAKSAPNTAQRAHQSVQCLFLLR